MYYNSFPKLNFIGNKEKLADLICECIPTESKVFFDAFSGGASVSFQAKKRGFKVISNDIMKINFLMGKALIENSYHTLDQNDLDILFSGKPIKGYMYHNYRNVLFFPEECAQLDQYRLNVNKLRNTYKKALSLILLRRAMIRKMPYSRFNLPWKKIVELRNENYSYEKYGRKRAYHNKSLQEHVLENLKNYNNSIFDNGQKNKALKMNVFDAIKIVEADVIYLDPPYTGTMNNYYSFYNAIDEYIESKHLVPFIDNFIDKNKSLYLFNKLFSSLKKYKYWILSYNNSSYPTENELIAMLQQYSQNIKLIEIDHAYKLTGKENKKKNKEFLFIVDNNLNTKKDDSKLAIKRIMKKFDQTQLSIFN